MPQPTEDILEPDLPIVDPHHHIWYVPDGMLNALDRSDTKDGREIALTYRLHRRYLFEDWLADATAGHNIRATVLVEAHTMYRATGPEAYKSLGEIEFFTGLAAMAASGTFTDIKLGAGIVGGVDLRLGDAVQDVLAAHINAGGGRYRGVRQQSTTYDAQLDSLKHVMGTPHIILDRNFRVGARHLEKLGLSLDLIVVDTQLPEVIDLARAHPGLQIIVDHTAMPIGIGPYAHNRAERFAIWRDNLRILAQSPNVALKLGGLGTPLVGMPSSVKKDRSPSHLLAQDWKPYIDAAIDIFGVNRCMFESNYPIDGVTASFTAIWNAYKRIMRAATPEDKLALFGGTAARVYRLEVK